MRIPLIAADDVRWTPIEDIFYIRLEGRRLLANTRDSILRPATTLADFHDILSDHGFDYADRATLLNLSKILATDTLARSVTLENGESLVVSRRNARKFFR